ncbi:CppA N-terminal domain-containing protein [Lactovum odontotermitis]
MKAERILPVYRINNRGTNLNFFENVLGMKVRLEDGPMVELGGHRAQKTHILLEETPVKGDRPLTAAVKKHNCTILRAAASEVAALFQRNKDVKAVEFQGAKGFSAISPEGDEFWLLESEHDKDNDAQGLSDFSVLEIKINVASATAAQQDFQIFEEISDKLKLAFVEQAPSVPDYPWDIEAIQIQLPKEADFNQLFARFSAFAPYLDAEHDLLSVALPEGIELWFEK